MLKANKKETSTLTYYKRWKAAKGTLNVAKFVAPCVPAAIITGINWDEWFVQTNGGLPVGFATLLIGIFASIYGYCNKDKIIKESISPFFFITTIMAIFGVSFLLLANIMQTMGLTFLYTCIGLLSGGIMDQVNKTTVESRVKEYKQLVEENCLDTKSTKRAQRKAKAEQERIAKAKAEAEIEATE